MTEYVPAGGLFYMSHIVLNELVVRLAAPEQTAQLYGLFSRPDVFNAILPVPEVITALGEDDVEDWCRATWGTEGLCAPFDIVSFESDTLFGDVADEFTLIVTFLTLWSPPDGIVLELSRMFPDAAFDLRFLDYDDSEGDVGWYRCLCGSIELRIFTKDDWPDYRNKLLRTPAN